MSFASRTPTSSARLRTRRGRSSRGSRGSALIGTRGRTTSPTTARSTVLPCSGLSTRARLTTTSRPSWTPMTGTSRRWSPSAQASTLATGRATRFATLTPKRHAGVLQRASRTQSGSRSQRRGSRASSMPSTASSRSITRRSKNWFCSNPTDRRSITSRSWSTTSRCGLRTSYAAGTTCPTPTSSFRFIERLESSLRGSRTCHSFSRRTGQSYRSASTVRLCR